MSADNESEVFEQEILAGTKHGDKPAKEVPEPRDHGKNHQNGTWSAEHQVIQIARVRRFEEAGVQVDTDPYSGATLAETVTGNQDDLDEAYYVSAKAQVLVGGGSALHGALVIG